MRLLYSVILLIFGFSLLIIGLALNFLIPVFVHNKVNALLPLKPGTVIYSQWQNTTVPAYLQFWFFNIVNHLEVLKGAKPYLQQIGPYTYHEYRIKHNITFNENGTVSYLQKRLFYFDRSRSVGDEDDIFTTVNIPLVELGKFLKDHTFLKLIMNPIIRSYHEKYFFVTSVKNITWGYKDALLDELRSVLERWHLSHLFNFPLEIGLFFGKNNTNDSIYTIDPGYVNLDHFLVINKWNGSDKLSIWNTDYANMINGTDGSMFSPFINESSRLYVFQSDICRSIYASYIGTETIKGIPSMNFAAPDILFANHTENPDNIGFCVDGYCMGAGVLNLTKCLPGTPVVMSQPHFYSAEAKYIDSVEGMSPSPEFKTVLKVEPTTGLPLNLQKKLQINIAIEPISGYLDIDNIPELILPVMWLNESALIDDGNAQVLRWELVIPVIVAHSIAYGLMVLGPLLIVIVVLINLKARSAKYKWLNSKPSNEDCIINEST